MGLSGTLQKRLDALLKGIGAELDVIVEATHSLSVSELVLRGLGISVVDPFPGAMHQARGGVTLPLRPGLPFTVQALAMGDTCLSAPKNELVRYLSFATHMA